MIAFNVYYQAKIMKERNVHTVSHTQQLHSFALTWILYTYSICLLGSQKPCLGNDEEFIVILEILTMQSARTDDNQHKQKITEHAGKYRRNNKILSF